MLTSVCVCVCMSIRVFVRLSYRACRYTFLFPEFCLPQSMIDSRPVTGYNQILVGHR